MESFIRQCECVGGKRCGGVMCSGVGVVLGAVEGVMGSPSESEVPFGGQGALWITLCALKSPHHITIPSSFLFSWLIYQPSIQRDLNLHTHVPNIIIYMPLQ